MRKTPGQKRPSQRRWGIPSPPAPLDALCPVRKPETVDWVLPALRSCFTSDSCCSDVAVKLDRYEQSSFASCLLPRHLSSMFDASHVGVVIGDAVQRVSGEGRVLEDCHRWSGASGATFEWHSSEKQASTASKWWRQRKGVGKSQPKNVFMLLAEVPPFWAHLPAV